MRIGLAQINTTIGDLDGNVAGCLDAIERAADQGAELVVLPEMVIPGYPPRDILYDTSFVESVAAATADLARSAAGGPPVVVGTIVPSGNPSPDHPGLYNAAVLLRDGDVQLVAAKRLLPAYDVFHESRWFIAGPPLPPINLAGYRLGFLVCEDLWDEGYPVHPPGDLVAAGAEMLVCLSASPFRAQIQPRRLYHARRHGCPVAYVNLVGANDELIFDGRSFLIDASGSVLAQAAAFQEDFCIADSGGDPVEASDPAEEEALFKALVLGIRDFAHKNGLRCATLGLSGGVDSAVVAVLAAEALGPANVIAVAIPSRYSDPRSTATAQELAAALAIRFEVVELEPLHATAEATLGELVAHGTAAENIQARLRALILMAFVNRYGGMLLNTSNKSELALGYGTLYGDMAGTLSPLGDVTKPTVYRLAHWIHAHRCAIPRFILDRPPSAELRPDQVDPFDYTVVSPYLEELVLANRSNHALRQSEHKRWHMGVILKVSDKAFGTGRLIPITRR